MKPMPQTHLILSDEHGISDLFHSHVVPNITRSLCDGPVDQTVKLVQEGNHAIHHVDYVRLRRIVHLYDLLNVLVLRGIAMTCRKRAILPLTNLENRKQYIHQTNEIEEDQIAVVEEVRLRVDRHIQEAVNVKRDGDHDVRTTLHKQHPFHIQNSLQYDQNHNQTDPNHSSRLNSTRRHGIREGVLPQSIKNHSHTFVSVMLL